MRTWRWHHLLRGGRGPLLSSEEQKGLLGELFVLERLLLPCISAPSAVRAWRGPLGSPKDFEVARVAIESKARRGGATPSISITSESQLDESGVDLLFLHVVALDEPLDDATHGVTVHDVAERIRTHLIFLAPSACGEYESRLSAAGYRAEDDYSDSSGWRARAASTWCTIVSLAFPQARYAWASLMCGIRYRWTPANHSRPQRMPWPKR